MRLGRQLGVAGRTNLRLEPPRDRGEGRPGLTARPAPATGTHEGRRHRRRPFRFPAVRSAPRGEQLHGLLDLGVGRLREVGLGHVPQVVRAGAAGRPSGSATLTSGSRPSCQIGRPLRVSQRSTPIRSDEPSARSNRPSTVPVPNVFSPTTVAAAGVLDGAGHDLRGARGVAVGEDDERDVGREAARLDLVVLATCRRARSPGTRSRRPRTGWRRRRPRRRSRRGCRAGRG